MLITLDRADLLSALRFLSAIAPRRSHRPVLECVRLDVPSTGAALLSATDGECYGMAEVASDAQEAGSVLLPLDRLLDMLKVRRGAQVAADEQVTLGSDGRHGEEGAELAPVLVTIGSRSCTVLAQPASVEDFPIRPPQETERVAMIDPYLLREALDFAFFAVATESSRYAMDGVLFEVRDSGLVVAGTDGRRLSVATCSVLETGGAVGADRDPSLGDPILPRTLAKALLSTHGLPKRPKRAPKDALPPVPVLIEHGPLGVLVSIRGAPRRAVFGRPIDGEYPRYRSVIPTSTTAALEVDPSALLAALSSVDHATDPVEPAVKFSGGPDRSDPFTDGGTVYVSARSNGSEASTSLDGASVSTRAQAAPWAVNPEYLTECAKAYDRACVGRVAVRWTDAKSPIKVEAAGERPSGSVSLLHVIMPLRID